MRRGAIVATLLLLLALLVGACWPVRVSTECQNRIDACLKNCPRTQPGSAPSDTSPTGTNDTRSFCEKRCHSLCHD